MTSVGYGDLFPGSDATILLACLFVFLGMLLIGLVLSKAADLLVEKQEVLLAKALHTHQTVGTAATIKQMESHRERNKCIILVFCLWFLFGCLGLRFWLLLRIRTFVQAFYCVVWAAEFILYKLKEMGKISQEDVAPIMEEFERLDFDKTAH
ncbi:two-pore potassium channel 1-like protein [Tanacetum coccineum]